MRPTHDQLKSMIRCAKREVTLRKRVYPGWVAARNMRQETADREIADMALILRFLESFHQPDLFENTEETDQP